MHILWTTTYSPAELPLLTSKLLGELSTASPFCLWLNGSLGAGKTTLTALLLRQLGLPEDEPVTSPTYTYMNEYEIAGRWYAHLDLYRTKGGFSSEDVGLADARTFSGIFVEWPELSPDDPYLQPTHTLDIAFTADGSSRIYTLKRKSPGVESPGT